MSCREEVLCECSPKAGVRRAWEAQNRFRCCLHRRYLHSRGSNHRAEAYSAAAESREGYPPGRRSLRRYSRNPRCRRRRQSCVAAVVVVAEDSAWTLRFRM